MGFAVEPVAACALYGPARSCWTELAPAWFRPEKSYPFRYPFHAEIAPFRATASTAS